MRWGIIAVTVFGVVSGLLKSELRMLKEATVQGKIEATSGTMNSFLPPPSRNTTKAISTRTVCGDGNDFPEMIAEWYRTHGYNFLALSDHNLSAKVHDG